jgi:hypothetical protein
VRLINPAELLDFPYHRIRNGTLLFGIWTCSSSLANSGPIIKSLYVREGIYPVF